MSKMDGQDGDAPTGPLKKCRYCGSWSNTACPWPLLGTPLQNWDPAIPWARGKPGKVVGDKCKLCQIVLWFCLFNVSFLSSLNVNVNPRLGGV